MSDEHRTVEITAELAGQWWYFAGMLRAILNRKRQDTGSDDWQWMNNPNPGGCILDIGPRRTRALIARALFVDKDDKTFLSVRTAGGTERIFREIVDDIKKVAYEAHEARRSSIGATFKEILEAYYAARAHGERPSLRVMADDAGANYASLRQYKIRYDKTHRS